jgi:hypothetical protein
VHLGRYWLVALVFALTACEAAPPPPRSAEKDTGTLATEALERGEYSRAADLYRKALGAEPERLPFHYGLGVAASYLDRRAEAVREFIWVLERGEAGSAQVKTARSWLLSVGALPRVAGTTPSPQEAREQQENPGEQKPPQASVQGRALFGEGRSAGIPMERMTLFLDDYPKRVVHFRIRTDEGGRFRFANVPPGIYRLTDRLAGSPRWRLRVELKPGQELTLDLDPANSTRFRDDFPGPTTAAGRPSS